MKIFNFTIIPLASILVLGGAMIVTRDYTTIETDTHEFSYTASWGSQSFDEALWQAVDIIARIEENLPPEIESFHIKIQPSTEELPVIQLDFERVYLLGLMAGEIPPETFIREHVDFN
ncbi:MAG: hypothetical protein ACETWG_11360 [Candidatus Neomarinimicrobiota bacterium]